MNDKDDSLGLIGYCLLVTVVIVIISFAESAFRHFLLGPTDAKLDRIIELLEKK